MDSAQENIFFNFSDPKRCLLLPPASLTYLLIYLFWLIVSSIYDELCFWQKQSIYLRRRPARTLHRIQRNNICIVVFAVIVAGGFIRTLHNNHVSQGELHEYEDECDRMLKWKSSTIFSKSCPKGSHSILLKSDVFQNSLKSHLIFGLLL